MITEWSQRIMVTARPRGWLQPMADHEIVPVGLERVGHERVGVGFHAWSSQIRGVCNTLISDALVQRDGYSRRPFGPIVSKSASREGVPHEDEREESESGGDEIRLPREDRECAENEQNYSNQEEDPLNLRGHRGERKHCAPYVSDSPGVRLGSLFLK